MVIQNSEVSMTSTTRYTSGMRLTVQSETKPIFNLEDINYLGDDLQADETEKEAEVNAVNKDDASGAGSGHQVRIRTMEYLIKMFLLGRYFNEDSEFGRMLRELLGCEDQMQGMGMAETGPLFV